MIYRPAFVLLVLICFFPVAVFSQQGPSAGALRDYVGLINQSYHPGIVSYFEKLKGDLEKKGQNNAAKSIEIFLGGSTGSGFVINDTNGNLYVVTNYHVIAQAHTLSITMERQDGFKKKFENLKIIAADEEIDLALLSFAAGDKPVERGLSFLTREAEEGEDVYSAGFPGLGITPIWQFGRGMVSNAAVKFPKTIYDDTLMGPFIQHTAQIDPGNSGGPLLIAQQNVPSGYAVAGINTLSGIRRQAANYAIPVSTVQAFINDALNPNPENYRAALDHRLAQFIEGLGANRAVYPHIAEYLSFFCVGENAEYAISEMYDKGNMPVKQAFIDKCEDSVVDAMGYAVAWIIETSIRGQGIIKASLKEVSGDGEEYTVTFVINGKDHSSKWVLEYGNWRIRNFGAVAAGDKEMISQKKPKTQISAKLRVDSDFHIEAGYASLFNKAPTAFYASFDYFSGIFGANLYVAGSDFWTIGIFAGYRWGIPAGNFGFMPYARAGINYQYDEEYKDFKDQTWGAGPSVAAMVQAGFKVISSYVPGFFIGTAFQYNVFDLLDNRYKNAMKMALSVSAGYAF